jgi:hypothetical protein
VPTAKSRTSAGRIARRRGRPVTKLRPADLKVHPIWRFVADDDPDETYVMPAAASRVRRLLGAIVGTEVTLADGSRRWALFSNVDTENPDFTEHFISVSLFVEGRWFHLARYHDFDATRRGPRTLAAALRRTIAEVFPISYDLRSYVRNAPPWLKGALHRSPRQRLTRAQVIALAVPQL